jgi:hypothetical protein
MCAYTRTCIHTHIHTYTLTYTHTTHARQVQAAKTVGLWQDGHARGRMNRTHGHPHSATLRVVTRSLQRTKRAATTATQLTLTDARARVFWSLTGFARVMCAAKMFVSVQATVLGQTVHARHAPRNAIRTWIAGRGTVMGTALARCDPLSVCILFMIFGLLHLVRVFADASCAYVCSRNSNMREKARIGSKLKWLEWLCCSKQTTVAAARKLAGWLAFRSSVHHACMCPCHLGWRTF